MIRILSIIAAFMIGTLVPISPTEVATAVVSENNPAQCGGADPVVVVNGEGATETVFYQHLVTDKLYVSWYNDGSVLEETTVNGHIMAIHVTRPSDDWSATIHADGSAGSGGQSGYCRELGEAHEFNFDVFSGVLGRSALDVSCSFEWTFGAGVSVSLSASGALPGAEVGWDITIECEVEGKIESAITTDLQNGYYHCPVVGTCLLDIQT